MNRVEGGIYRVGYIYSRSIMSSVSSSVYLRILLDPETYRDSLDGSGYYWNEGYYPRDIVGWGVESIEGYTGVSPNPWVPQGQVMMWIEEGRIMVGYEEEDDRGSMEIVRRDEVSSEVALRFIEYYLERGVTPYGSGGAWSCGKYIEGDRVEEARIREAEERVERERRNRRDRARRRGYTEEEEEERYSRMDID